MSFSKDAILSLAALILTATASTLPAAAAADSPGGPVAAESDIFGGTQSTPDSFPSFIVALDLDDEEGKGSQWCGGVLINAYTVLTTAHCSARHNDPSVWSVHAGSLAWNLGGVKVGVSSWIFHPGYDNDHLDNDVVLWRLSAPIQRSSTVCYANLPAQGFDPPPGANITTAGWGMTHYELQDTPQYLRQLTNPVFPRAECQKAIKPPWNVTDNMFCAGTEQGQSTVCFGDSGGPAVPAEDRGGHGWEGKTVWGLVSWRRNDDCGGPSDPYDVYVRVGQYVDWINKHKFLS